MLKKALVIGILVLPLAFVGSAFADGAGIAKMVLDGGSQGNVSFPHWVHQEKLKDCDDCHKLFPMEEGAIKKLKASGKLKKQEVMNVCKSCHEEIKKKGHTAGPTSCEDCHDK